MPYFKPEENIELYYEEHGSGETLIFVNGIVFTTASWHFQKVYFRKQFRTVLYDMRCQGQSSNDMDSLNYGDQVEDLAKFVSFLMKDQENKKVHLCGLSYGSFVAKEFAVRYPDLIKKLILIAPVRKVDFITSFFYKSWNDLLEKKDLDGFYDITLTGSYVNMRKHLSERVYNLAINKFKELFTPEAILKLLHSFDRESIFANYPEITVPTLVIGASHDNLHNPEDGKVIASEIENAQFITINGGHAINIENAEEINQAIEKYITT